ncbi:MAG: hypothetical protein GF416_00815 [Candidatus Altiarchaeales archaeon]|nr:hypothetical protein [Candidatus Altiarchaeales archaeon]MBD3415659.1 hypothetical protein [Candidatus Altiarchaeales archaeon]
MISYADIEKAHRQERSTPILQKLHPDFYIDARKLIENPETGDYAPMVSDMLEKIYSARVNKLIHHAGRALGDSKSPDNMLPEERKLYDRLLAALSESRASVLEREVQVEVEEEKPTLKVRVKRAMPAIVGSDSVEYGPFREDDVVELPVDSAELLIKQGIAEKP